MNTNIGTIVEALVWATGQLKATTTTARLDAELLLAHVLKRSRSYILAEGAQQLSTAEQKTFCNLIARRAHLEPVAYLIGHKEFYGLDFFVTPAVLVPRPETELLVERTLEFARSVDKQSPIAIADIGTGSGIIAVALALYLPQAWIYAVDISPEALDVARQNAERYAVSERIHFIQGDLLTPLKEPVDLIVSNPPYTVLAEIDENVRQHEPHTALDGGLDGLDVYRRLLDQAPGRLRAGGAILLEIGATQRAAITALAQAHFPEAQVRTHKDLAGWDRVVVITPHTEDQNTPIIMSIKE